MADDRSDRASVPTLIVTGGPLDGTAYPLPGKGETVVGSSMDAGVQIMLGNVEPFHARIVDGPGGLVIEDAGSATGTFVNGEKVFEYEQPQLDESDADARRLIVDGNKMLREGTISLQSESHPIEFRKVEIMVLKE